MPVSVAANAPLPGIEHIIVLMFENRSFDNVLGSLYPSSSTFNGIDTNFSNTANGNSYSPTNTVPSGNNPYITPYPDPGELQSQMNSQIFNGASSPTMGGFAQNYADVGGNPGDILFYFAGNQLWMTSYLGAQYAVSDNYFGSGPVQTLPNRMFAACGTPGSIDVLGFTAACINDRDYVANVSLPTSIYELLDNAGGTGQLNWKVYFHDWFLSMFHPYVSNAFNNDTGNVASFDTEDYDPPYGTTFFDDLANGTLPPYSVIEPRYLNGFAAPDTVANSNHPGNGDFIGLTSAAPIDVEQGELLLFQVLLGLALAPNDLLNKTLLVVTYDENGGVADHQPPPASVSPFPGTTINGGVYDIFGPRVPALFINPQIPANTILEPSGSTPFDHTSILATVCAQFGLPVSSLTNRVQGAPVFSGLIPADAAPRSTAIPDALKQRADAVRRPRGKGGPRRTPAEWQDLAKRFAARHGAR